MAIQTYPKGANSTLSIKQHKHSGLWIVKDLNEKIVFPPNREGQIAAENEFVRRRGLHRLNGRLLIQHEMARAISS